MDKVKLQLPYIDAKHFSNRLKELITDYAHTDPKMNKLFSCLWLQIYLKFEKKTAFVYDSDKSYSLTVAEAIAFELLVRKWQNAAQEATDEQADYRYNLYQSVTSFIDQKTA